LCLVAGVVACDPIAAVTVGDLLRPTPSSDCLARALGASPLVALVHEAADTHGGFAVALRAPINISAIDPEVSVRLMSGASDSSRIQISFRLYGRPTWAVDKADSRLLDSIGTALARDVSKVCSPGSPEKHSCRVDGMFWSKGCD